MLAGGVLATHSMAYRDKGLQNYISVIDKLYNLKLISFGLQSCVLVRSGCELYIGVVLDPTARRCVLSLASSNGI